MREPTTTECSTHAPVDLEPGMTGTACWYPKMGGYVARAVAVIDDDLCIDVYVWHDGEFPFDGLCQDCRIPRQPVKVHHCDPGEFIKFGQFLETL